MRNRFGDASGLLGLWLRLPVSEQRFTLLAAAFCTPVLALLKQRGFFTTLRAIDRIVGHSRSSDLPSVAPQRSEVLARRVLERVVVALGPSRSWVPVVNCLPVALTQFACHRAVGENVEFVIGVKLGKRLDLSQALAAADLDAHAWIQSSHHRRFAAEYAPIFCFRSTNASPAAGFQAT